MRIHTSLPVAFLSIGILASAGCSDQRAEITAPEAAVTEASFQQQSVRQITQGTLIAALNNVNVNIQDLIDIGTIQDVQVVNIEDVLNNNNILNNSRFLNNIQILQNFLNNNDIDVAVELSNFLNENQIAINDVVAIDVLSGGDLIVFTQ